MEEKEAIFGELKNALETWSLAQKNLDKLNKESIALEAQMADIEEKIAAQQKISDDAQKMVDAMAVQIPDDNDELVKEAMELIRDTIGDTIIGQVVVL